jgi:hypothetical protein
LILNIPRLRIAKAERTIALFGVLWAIAQLVSDIHNETQMLDAAKGVFAPIVFIGTIVGLARYFKTHFSYFPSFLLGVTLGGLISLLLFPTDYFNFNPWKWGLSSFFLSLIAILFSFFVNRKSKTLLFVVLIILMAVSFSFNSRSMAIFPLIAALAYVSCYNKKESRTRRWLSGRWAATKALLVVLPALMLINVGATALFSSDEFLSKLPGDAASTYKVQATGDFGILIGARSEILISGQALLDKPMLGHGSWAKDRDGYLDKYAVLRHQLGYNTRDDNQYESFSSDLIPVHSYLMGAFVWAGIFGGLFWLVTLSRVYRAFIATLSYLPYYFYFGMIGFVWDVFFSPFGANARWNASIFLAAFSAYHHYLKANWRVNV